MKKFLFVLAIAALALWSAPAQAADVVLTSGNSTATINPTSSIGMHSWVVDGTNQLFQQWFWFRIDTPGAAGPVQPINALATPTVVQAAGNFALLTYTGTNGLSITVSYLLNGGQAGTNTSDIAETIVINNMTDNAMDLSFFQYSDFDLNGQVLGQSVNVSPTMHNTVSQSGAGAILSETVVTPGPTFWEAGLYPTLINLLNSGTLTNLNDVSSAGPGDAIWAFQWDHTLAAHGSFIISKDKNLRPIPEPGSMLLLGTGLFGLAGAVRRRLKK